MEKKSDTRYAILKDIVGIHELETTDTMIPELEVQLLLYFSRLTFSFPTCLLTVSIGRLSYG